MYTLFVPSEGNDRHHHRHLDGTEVPLKVYRFLIDQELQRRLGVRHVLGPKMDNAGSSGPGEGLSADGLEVDDEED